jgi:hypothetical protein
MYLSFLFSFCALSFFLVCWDTGTCVCCRLFGP